MERSAESLLTALVAGIDDALPEAQTLRRAIHADPRLGGDEGPTRRLVRAAISRAGIRTCALEDLAQTGLLTRVGPASGPAVAVRGELDALPLTETTGVPWAATNGAMHACGHDLHVAAVWALLHAAARLDLPTALLAVFQPREEVEPSGAADVVAAGVLPRHDVRAVLGVHVQPQVPLRTVSTGAGGVNAANDEFDIVVRGHGGHGAYPHLTSDPVPVLAAITTALYELVGRRVDPTHPTVLTVGRLEAGTRRNVVPSQAMLHGMLRTTDDADRQRLGAAIRAVAEHTAAARGASADVQLVLGEPALVNAANIVEATDPLLAAAGLRVAPDPFRSCGSDDFSRYREQAPTLMMFVGTGDRSGEPPPVGLHHPEFLPEESVLRDVAVALAAGYVGATQALDLR